MSDDDFAEQQPEEHDSERSAAKPSAAETAILGDPNRPKRSRRESKDERIEREKLESDAYWRAQLNDRIGRRELWRIACGAEGAHAFDTRFAGGPTGVPNEYATWYAKGEQDLGLRLYHRWIALDPVAVALMHQENDSRFANPAKSKGE